MIKLRKDCPVCFSSNISKLRHFSFIAPQGHPISEGYDLAVCENCGFVYAQINAAQEDYDEYYEKVSKYQDSKTSTGSGDADWEKKRFIDTASVLAKHLKNDQATICDIGCANGGQLIAFKDINYVNLYGIDPADSSAQQCKEKGLLVHRGTVSHHDLTNDFFDCVILSHVLEHIVDLQTTIEVLCSLENKNGLLYIEVPDANRYKDFLFSPYQDINTEHINHFSEQVLRTLFSEWKLIDSGKKDIFSSPDKPYPAMFCVFQKIDTNQPQLKVIKDEELLKNIRVYLDQSANLLSSINSELQTRLKAAENGSPEIIVWGTGQLAMKLLTETCLQQFKIVGFIDGNPINQGRFFAEQKILAPTEISTFSQKVPILITTTLHQNEIIDVIKNLNISNPIITIE